MAFPRLRHVKTILCVAASISTARAQTAVENAADPYVHAPTGMVFPARIAGAVRHQVDRYDADGTDMGVGYQVVRDDRMVAYLSVFVYPAPTLNHATAGERRSACKALSDGIGRDIAAHEPTAALMMSDSVAAPVTGTGLTGLRIVYVGGRGTFDGKEQALREQNDLFCFVGAKWLIAYRVTMPAGMDASADVARVERALSWPTALLNKTN